MKKVREKWLIKERRENEEQEHHHKRKETQKINRNKKKLYIKNVRGSIEKDQTNNSTRKMYQTRNKFQKEYHRRTKGISYNRKYRNEWRWSRTYYRRCKKAMRNLKTNKAAGTDGIHSELIKCGENKLLNRIYELEWQIWEEERIAEEWKKKQQ